jgi:C4-dicarboxylate-specific signal transduction histidine kinase
VSVARMQFGEALAHDAGRTGDRSVVLAVLTGVLIVWTVVLVAAPSLRVSGSALRIRESTEAASALAASLTAPMTYVRFALDRERVWLFISLVFARVGVAVFRVHDHGPRVTSGSRDRLFDRSFRVDQDPETGAQGIGLYISRRIVEAQRGRIWVDGTNSGATFAITLPLCEGAS